ncbi:MAG: DNA primase DnaG [Rhodanobacteraceae bacterium]|jgi:DNA primase|nr:MAG: DNA primase DnaG [Rhodanobacteraceae bacterium]
MPGLIPERFIDELLARVDIVDVVQQRVPLKRAGREWTACCPFHDERTPSFYVSPAKQFYHCFGCGAHGSAVRFLMEYDRLEFPDAVEELAQSVGLTVPHEGGPARPREDHTDLYALLDAAATFYQRALPDSTAAKAYCKKRGLDAAIIERFRIGWAPGGWDALKRQLGTNDARNQLLEQAGMISTGDGGKRYDRFRERLMFPIIDRRGRVIAFGGRIITSASNAHSADAARGEGPKYLNSPETPLFHKGRELFALWQVRQANTKLERLIVVEGYMDVVALHQAGITQAVATLGTATTNEHAELLFRAAPDVFFCFDGDRAGRSAAWRALESVLPRMRDGRQAFFLFLPEGEDPDTLVRKEGREGFEARLKNATPLSEYFYAYLSHDVNVATLDGRARLAEHAKPLLAKLPDGAFRDLMFAELEKRTGVQTAHAAPPVLRQPTAPATNAPKRTLVRSAIAMLLANPALAQDVTLPYAFAALDKPGIPLLIELLDFLQERPGVNTALLLEHFSGREESAALQKLALTEFPGEPEALRAEFTDAMRKLAEQTTQQRLDGLIRKQSEGALGDAEKNELRELLAGKAGRLG